MIHIKTKFQHAVVTINSTKLLTSTNIKLFRIVVRSNNNNGIFRFTFRRSTFHKHFLRVGMQKEASFVKRTFKVVILFIDSP